MSRAWLTSLLVTAIAAGCLLPDVSLDPALEDPDPNTVGNANLPGVGGTSGSSGAGGSTNAAAGSGAGGAAGSSMAAAGTAGTGTVSQPEMPVAMAGAGGAGGANTGAAGAGGSTMRTAAASCAVTEREEACAAYCANYQQSCGDFPPAYTYAGRDCGTICYNSLWPVGNVAEKGSILCRCFHATLALNNGLTPHCYHAAEVPSMANGCELPTP